MERFFIVGIILAWLAGPLAAEKLPRPLPGNPGNVFIEGAEVAVKIAGMADADPWVCVDYEGKEIKRGSGSEIRLGRAGIGYYEIWKLGADGARTSRVTLAVLSPLKAATPDDSPIALDTAASWFYRNEKSAVGLREAANLTSLAGVNWVRDRLSWKETEPAKGKFADELIYDRSAAAFAAEGIKVLQVFHDTPPWAGQESKRMPDDLRDVYSYLKTMSAKWRGKVAAWEPWNEGDTYNFGWHTGAEMASYQKAAYHGLKAGNANAIVCQSAFAENHRTGVLENFMESDAVTAFDKFDFHHYLSADSLPQAYSEMRPANGGKPVWITESYFQFPQRVQSGDLDLPVEIRRERARFVTRNIASALSEGPEKVFTFLLPHYIESGTLYGMLNADGTPRPDYVALAAAGRLLAGAKTLGKFNDLTDGTSAHAFSSMVDGFKRVVVVAWTNKDKSSIPAFLSAGNVIGYHDFLGRPMKETPEILGKNPIYYVFEAGTKFPLIPPPVYPHPAKGNSPSPLVLQALIPGDRLRLNTSSWLIKPDEPLNFSLRLYQFGNDKVDVSLSADSDPYLVLDGLPGSQSISHLELKEMKLQVRLKSNQIPPRPLTLKLTAITNGHAPSVISIRFSAAMNQVQPEKSVSVASAAESGRWLPQASAGKIELTPAGKGIEVKTSLTSKDKWVYPWLKLRADEIPDDAWDGVSFVVTRKAGAGGFKAMLKENGGSIYVNDFNENLEVGKSARIVMLFKDFAWGVFSPEDKNRRFELKQLEGLSIGGNPSTAEFGYQIEAVEWVRFVR